MSSLIKAFSATCFLFASLIFFACSDDSGSGEDLLDGTNYVVSETEDCNGVEYNPKIQFCSVENIKSKDEFIDERDGKTYKIVKIGNQIWMSENLNYEIVNNRCYDNNLENCEKCGKLYSWFTATENEICPNGWRLPNNDDWDILNRTAGGDNGAKLMSKNSQKSCSWSGYSCTDDYGFSALACGCALYFSRGDNYNFNNLGYAGYFWSSTETPNYNHLAYNYMPGSLDPFGEKQSLKSVRCIKN